MGFRRLTTAFALVALGSIATSEALAQNAAIFTGRITTAAGQPLGGANVGVPALGVGGVADAEGRYTFTVDVSGRTGRSVEVVARSIGYKPKRLPITLQAGRVEHNFSLERDVLNLEEVVVTGTSEATSQKKATFSVSVVDNSSIKDAPASSPLGSLVGKIPSASLVTTSGQPGSEPSIRLRSATSLTGRQDPLIIIDGTISRLQMADMNSEDIERIEVIKGAAASSLYGSDAANGVIQIFTKRGGNLAEGQTLITFRNEFGANSLPNIPERNMHHNYRLTAAGQFDVSGGGRTGDADLIADNNYPVIYDQFNKVFQTSQKLTNYLSIGQRRGSTNYNVSFQNEKDEGVLRLVDGYRRQNFRMNIDQALSNKLDVGAGAFYGRSVADQADDDFGMFFSMVFLEPNVNIDSVVTACPGGTICSFVGQHNPIVRQPPLSGNVSNPLYDLETITKTNSRDRFTGTLRSQFRMLDWLSLDGNVGYDVAGRVFKDLTPVGYTTSSNNVTQGSLRTLTRNDRSYNINVGLTAIREFGSVRNTTKIAGLYEDQTNNFTDVNASQLAAPKVPEFGVFGGTVTPDSRTEIIRAQNAFAVTTFDIKDRYILDGLVRRDESSLFGADNRSATYHRLSGAWRVTEDFTIPGFDELKLRVSQGTAGLRPIYTAQYETFAVVGGNLEKQTLGNNKLKPAYSRETEYGFNANFLTNYSLDYSYSRKRTTDQIILVPLSGATGYLNQYQNAGTLSGHSHEIGLGAVLLSKADYFWRLNITGDRTRQKIEDLSVPPFFVGPDPNDGNTRIFRIAANQPFGVIYGSQWIKTPEQLAATIAAGRLTGTTADYRLNEQGYYVRTSAYQTINEVPLKAWKCDAMTGTTCTASSSITQIGDVNPDFNMGFNTTAQWKALSLSGTLSWVKGGDIYNYTRHWPFNELRDRVFDESAKPATTCAADWPATAPTCPYTTGKKPSSYYSTFYNNFDANEFFVEDGSYMRLRELALSFNVPGRWVNKLPLGFNGGRIGIVGRNLWTSTDYSGYDPDVSGPGGGNPFAYRVDYFTYPAYRTFTAMLELNY
jgi:TonB-linked SusC/RagA family outer membrane protein